ncbi:MAG: S8 family serine peptidase [Pseudomonadota bacterium]
MNGFKPSHFFTSLVFCLIFVLSACGGGGGSDDGEVVAQPTPNQSPVAAFTNATNGLELSLDASGSSDADGTIASFSWDFGDGNTGQGSVTTHTYQDAGDFTVTLTVTDDDGATSTSSANVSVVVPNQVPIATFSTTNDGLFLVADAAASSDPDGAIVSYEWTLGDGTSASGLTTSHTYDIPGTYEVQLNVTDDERATSSQTQMLTVENATTLYSLSGVITTSANTFVDSDTNDPFTNFAPNNDLNSAQEVPSPLQLVGFVTETQTNQEGDVFSDATDQDDFFRADLLEGQFVSLRVVDFDSSNPSSVDIDLGLRDQSGELIEQSLSFTEFESVQVPANGTYFIQVRAFSGTSKYLLNIGNTSLNPNRQNQTVSADFVPGEVIVQSKETPEKSQTQPVGERLAGLGLHQKKASYDNGPQLMQIDALSDVTTTLKSKPQAKALSQSQTDHVINETLGMIKRLRMRDEVLYAEPNYRVYPQLTPNDTFYSRQWHYPIINLPQAWDITTGTPANGEVIVAVVDTGVVLNHEDLSTKLVDGFDFISDPTNARDNDGIDSNPDDPGDNANLDLASWHGTHVAGTVGAASDNNLGVAGVSWGAQIMPIRVLGADGGDLFDVLQGMRYAAGLSNSSGTVPTQRADIINLSLGGGGFSQTVQDSVDEIREAGVILIAAAGNESTSTPSFPAAYDGVISVSATDLRNQLSPFSNFGETIDVAAPGGNTGIDADGDGAGDGVLSTAIEARDNVTRNSAYVYYQGTSMSSPHVAGVAALMKAVHPELTPDELDSVLINGDITTDLGEPGRDNAFGHGLIDALKAVQSAQSLAGGTQTGAISISPLRVDFGRLIDSATINVERIGSNPPSITSIATSDTFISVDSSAVDANGAGLYTLSIDRSGLDNGLYNEQVTFTGSNESNLVVDLTVEVGDVFAGESDTGILYLVAFDPETSENLAQLALFPEDGQYTYEFDELAPRDYLIIGGSDIDNDGVICSVGEICAAFATVNETQVITLVEDRANLNFGAIVVTGVNVNDAAGTAPSDKKSGAEKGLTSLDNKEIKKIVK